MIGNIIIVARNNSHLTKRAVKSALLQDVPVVITVINNACNDGTGPWLKTKQVNSVTFQVQHSLASCWNFGLKCMLTPENDTALVLNNDVEIRSDTYSLLAECCKEFVSAVSVDDKRRIGNAGDRTANNLLESLREHPDFSCFMIRKSLYDKIGHFDDSYYPAYVEDCDYHVRIHKAGLKAYCVDLPFYHAGAQTVKTAERGEYERIRRAADTNREKFRLKYGCLPGTAEYNNLFKVSQSLGPESSSQSSQLEP